MKEFMRILRDPNLEPPAGGPPVVPAASTAPATPAAPAASPEVPRTKEQWDALRTADPGRWMDLTQTRMDQTTREKKEALEQKAAADLRAKNLEAELAAVRRTQVPPATPPGTPPAVDLNKPFSRENMPQTDEQWEQLWLENPNQAADLRHFKNEQDRQFHDQQTQAQKEFINARRSSVQTLAERHPDMYVPERDADGNVKVDDKGKVVLKINPSTGLPIPDLESPKFRVFDRVYNEDAAGYNGSKHGPRLAMLEMERVLQEEGNKQIQAGQQGAGQSGQNSGTPPDQRGSMPSGVTPPVTAKVSFKSDEERQYAERGVQRQVYKSLEEYCALRDGKPLGIVEENRTPQFNR